MGFLKFGKKEARSVQVKQSDPDFLQRMGFANPNSVSGAVVNTTTALGVPAIWCAVNFLSGTIAGLPLKVYRKAKDGREEVPGLLSSILHDAVNPETTSFQWRKNRFDGVFTTGRGYTYIEKNNSGQVVNLWPINPATVTVTMSGGKRTYTVSDGTNGAKKYSAAEIIDTPFMLRDDMVNHRAPIFTMRDTIGMAIDATGYGAKAFQSGGLPPAAIQANFQSEEAARRASNQISGAMAKNATEGKPIIALPMGHELKALGFSPEQMQLIDLKRFSVEEVARMYQLPPAFLQDLTHGTFSNTEQQDLHLVKHTIKRWVEQDEQEMNLKFFGRGSEFYVEYSMDGLLRGDIKTRMESHATAIQNGIYTPAFAAEKENAPFHEEADQVFIQGGTMPIPTATGDDGENATSVDLNEYGVAVRAGVITPQVEDEKSIRRGAGLPEMSAEAVELWGDQGGVRQPITLQSGQEAAALADDAATDLPKEGEENDE